MQKTIKITASGLLISAFILISAGSLFSQRERPERSGDRVERNESKRGMLCMRNGGFYRLNHMQEKLELSDQQVKQIFDIKTRFRQQMFDNRKDSKRLAELKELKVKEIESILTDEQKEKVKNNRRGFHRSNRGNKE